MNLLTEHGSSAGPFVQAKITRRALPRLNDVCSLSARPATRTEGRLQQPALQGNASDNRLLDDWLDRMGIELVQESQSLESVATYLREKERAKFGQVSHTPKATLFGRVFSSANLAAVLTCIANPGSTASANVPPIRDNLNVLLRRVNDVGEKVQEHLKYLRHISDPNGERLVSAATAARARITWQFAWMAAGPNLPVPAAGVGPDGQILYSWNYNEHHLEVEIFADQPAEWFYRNRKTGEVLEFDQNPGSALSPELINKLNLVLSSH